MSIPLRTKRLQMFLNKKFKAKIDEDGAYGLATIGALEAAFGIEDAMQTTRPKLKTQFDERTEKNLATLDPKAAPEIRKLVGLAVQIADENGVVIKVISGNRTFEEQDKLYAQGRTEPGKIVTNARGGFSNHNFGIAVDMGVFRGSTYLDGSNKKADRDLAASVHRQVSERAKANGLNTEWGGDWTSIKDFPHHELKTGLSTSQKRSLFLEKGTVLG